MRLIWTLVAALSLATGMTQEAEAVVLENAFVRVTVDPPRGGGVTALRYKKAVTLPYIAERGAGVAGTGCLFTGLIEHEGRLHDLASVAFQGVSSSGPDGETVLKLTAPLPAVSAGLSLERTLRLGREESGFRLTETLRNDGPGAREVTLRVGGRSHQQAESWRLALRCWLGDGQRGLWHFTPYNAGETVPFEATAPELFWRMIGQYGVGVLYQVRAPRAPVELRHALPKEIGNPADFQWLASLVTLAPGAKLTWESAALVDEGGREGSRFPDMAVTDRLIVTADVRAAGRVGETLPACGTVVSAVPRRIRMVVTQSARKGDQETGRKVLREAELALEPGKARTLSYDVTAETAGVCMVAVEILDEQRRVLASTRARTVIDGAVGQDELGRVWERFTSRLPEVVCRGTWEEIGAQLARSSKPGPLKAKAVADGRSGERLAFYEREFPLYARLLKGAAAALEVGPEKLVQIESPPPEAAKSAACMGVFLNGPDGPINAYSKERGNNSLSGLGYVKVIPDVGYPYHMYTLGDWSFGYGVNAAGLCTSGATINCDKETEQRGEQTTAAWLKAGRPLAPLGVHMMLATCKDVAEAVAFIENPRAPFSFTGNMLLVDRAGNAAILESVGIFHQIRRRQAEAVFATGNYAHVRSDGLFQCGDNWGWAANTMLREQALAEVLAAHKGQIPLAEAVRLMESHTLPGNMCQHVFENPGQLYSSCSCIAVALTGELFISNGPPCQVQTVRYTLEAR